ncbi:MAG: hypothetical protein Q4A41_03390, partial [Bacillota bacterium]|nr:hypothetical protein [Bacillota bacterium]
PSVSATSASATFETVTSENATSESVAHETSDSESQSDSTSSYVIRSYELKSYYEIPKAPAYQPEPSNEPDEEEEYDRDFGAEGLVGDIDRYLGEASLTHGKTEVATS